MNDDAHGVRMRQNMNEETGKRLIKIEYIIAIIRTFFCPFPCLFGPHLSIRQESARCLPRTKQNPAIRGVVFADFAHFAPFHVDGVCRSAQATFVRSQKLFIRIVYVCNQKHRRYKYATSNGFGYTHLIPSMSASLHASQVWLAGFSVPMCDAMWRLFPASCSECVCKRLFAVLSHGSSIRVVCQRSSADIASALDL